MMKIRPPFRRKAMTLRAAVLLVGIVAAWFFVGKAPRRQEIVSQFGQCRFTLGAGWRYEPTFTDCECDYLYRPSNLIQRWLQEHLMDRYPDADIKFIPELGTRPFSDGRMHYPEDVRFDNGSPAVLWTPPSTRHLIIDGCPATVDTYPSSKAPSTLETHLYIYNNNSRPTMLYEFVAKSYRKGDQIDREMQAIIASFHVDKG